MEATSVWNCSTKRDDPQVSTMGPILSVLWDGKEASGEQGSDEAPCKVGECF